MKTRTVELRIKKGWVSEGWQKDYSAFAGFIHNVARIEETHICTFFYDGNDSLIATFAADVVVHDFLSPFAAHTSQKEEPTTICTYCKEPLTSDDFKLRGCTTMHEHCKEHLENLENERYIEDVRENHPDPMKGFTTKLDNFYGDKS